MPNPSSKTDISTQIDVDHLVRAFYDRALKDDLLSPHFAGVDLEHHFPRMIAFWSLILIDQEGYKSNVFDKHVHLDIDKSHFDRWVELFCQTVDDYFIGEKAGLAKQRAKLLGYTFASKMKKTG